MPNWCANQVDISGSAEDIAKLVALVKDGDESFSFAKIVPPPNTEVYNGAASSSKYVCGCESELVDGKRMVNGIEIEVSGKCPTHDQPSMIDSQDNWYHWNISNWGTKWDAKDPYQTDYTDGDTATEYQFDTAWGPAEPVVAALAEQFPNVVIHHRYCEGGMGYAGQISYLNGVESHREEYDQDEMPKGAFTEDYERDYDVIPQTAFERFAEEHFGGVVGG